MSNSASSLFPLGPDTTPYRKISDDGVAIERVGAREFLTVSPDAIKLLAKQAFIDINHLLRPGHLQQLAHILDDPEATSNDKFVAFDLLKNANIAAGGVLPMCQDTGTAIVMGKRGRFVMTDGHDEDVIADGILSAYLEKNLRYSQLAPISMFEEKIRGPICLPKSISTRKERIPSNFSSLRRAEDRLTRHSCFRRHHPF